MAAGIFAFVAALFVVTTHHNSSVSENPHGHLTQGLRFDLCITRTRALSVLAPYWWCPLDLGRPSHRPRFGRALPCPSSRPHRSTICIKVCSMLPLPLVFAFVFLSDICPTAAQTKTIDNTLKAIIRFIVQRQSFASSFTCRPQATFGAGTVTSGVACVKRRFRASQTPVVCQIRVTRVAGGVGCSNPPPDSGPIAEKF